MGDDANTVVGPGEQAFDGCGALTSVALSEALVVVGT